MLADDDRHPVDQLAEEFAEQIRAGDAPQIDDYCRKYPEHADMIRAVFPSIQLVERANKREDQHRRSGESHSASSLPHSMPQTLGDFQLIREIGRGGMGVVYEALQRSLKRHVALKVINALISGSEKQLRRFRREAESAASLHHSNIVPVYGIGEDQGLQYYAMQLIDGVTLAEIIHQLRRVPARILAAETTTATASSGERNTGPATANHRFGSHEAVRKLLGSMSAADVYSLQQSEVSVDLSAQQPNPVSPLAETRIKSASSSPGQNSVTLVSHEQIEDCEQSDDLGSPDNVYLNSAYFRNIARLMADVANAVDYAHRQGILHRDLKPANLILDRDGTIWVADFGLARQADFAAVTQTGEIVGTLRYMAPEQLRGKADIRTDVYALGLTLYELLAMKPAIAVPQVLDGQGRKTLASLRASRPEIPADLETITLKACMPEPERRYQSAHELEADLQRFLQDRPIHARRVTPFERMWRWSRRNPQIASLSAATLFLLFAIVIVLGISNRRIQKALNARNTEYSRAELNLAEKTTALQNVERERARAETNLDLAIAAFEQVFDNIAARGRSDSLLDELSEQEFVPAADAVLSNADVTLLETLLGFFDQLALENSKDLGTESAAARKRVGDIQQQLGRLDNAQTSYRLALDGYRAVAEKNPDAPDLTLAQATILHQMMQTAAKQGEMLIAANRLQDMRKLLSEDPSASNAPEQKFLLARAINTLVSYGLRSMGDLRVRPRNPLMNRILGGNEPSPPGQNDRLQRHADLNDEATKILQTLAAADPSNISYRIELAQATKDRARLAQSTRDWDRADEAMSTAIRILENLNKEFPSSDRFKYELADTLSAMTTFRPSDMQRLLQAQQLCRELVDAHPTVPEYRSLYATTLARIAGIQLAQGKTDRAEAMLKESLTQHEQLANQFPDVLMYQIALVRTLQQLAVVYNDGKRTDDAKKSLDSAITRMESLANRPRLRNAVNNLLPRLRDSRARLGN